MKGDWQIIFGAERGGGKVVLRWKPGNKLVFPFVVLLISNLLVNLY